MFFDGGMDKEKHLNTIKKKFYQNDMKEQLTFGLHFGDEEA